MLQKTFSFTGRFLLLFSLLIFYSCIGTNELMKADIYGEYVDDYGIEYSITDSLWHQLGNFQIDVLELDLKQFYLLGCNRSDSTFTRIDFVKFRDQGAFKWGFCYSSYDEASIEKAMKAPRANQEKPRTGCNGFPFSRMKKK